MCFLESSGLVWAQCISVQPRTRWEKECTPAPTLNDVKRIIVVLWQHDELQLRPGGSPVVAAAGEEREQRATDDKRRFVLAGAILSDPPG